MNQLVQQRIYTGPDKHANAVFEDIRRLFPEVEKLIDTLTTSVATRLFAVKVTYKSGANGDKTHAAAYLYTVKNLAGTTLADDVALTRPRPYGTATYQSANSYGLAFYDGATLKLWDAGEIYGTGGCA